MSIIVLLPTTLIFVLRNSLYLNHMEKYEIVNEYINSVIYVYVVLNGRQNYLGRTQNIFKA